MPSLTEGLTRHIQEKSIKNNDLEAAAQLTLDAVANALAGRNSAQGRILLKWAAGRAMDPGREAFLMGALTHILEVDDLHKSSVVHPGCVVIPAAWALARAHGASGHGLLKAIIWGFEATTRVGMAVGPAHYQTWHNTATCGPYGSAAAGAALLGLSALEMVHALGNAGTQSAGLWQFLESGAMSKHLHAGRGAEAGLVAAELAASGFTGPKDILEGAKGFFKATCPDALPDMVLAEPDAPWQIHATSLKPWPSCRHTHPGIYAAQELRKKVGNRAIKAVRIDTYKAALALCDRPEPETVYEAKFSLQHCIAAALSGDKVSFASFETEARAALSELRGRISLSLNGRYEAAYPLNWGSGVEVDLEAGETLTSATDDAFGDPELPMARGDIITKAEMLMRHGGVREPAGLVAAILALAEDAPLPALPD